MTEYLLLLTIAVLIVIEQTYWREEVKPYERLMNLLRVAEEAI